MTDFPLILQLDIAGAPQRWINYEKSAYYFTKGLVAFALSPVEIVLRGGMNAKTGKQSTLEINTIIAVRGEMNKRHKERAMIPPLTNKALFRRDRHVCAYCGGEFGSRDLSRDHVTPTSKGGPDIWTNVVTACGKCNKFKDNRTPEQAGMKLLYVPYAPNRAEWLILENRRILSDQMDFLIKSVPKESRLRLQ